MSDEFEGQNKEIEAEAALVTLVDEDGQEQEFEVIDSAELGGQEYVALVPVFEQPEELLDDSGELVILRVAEENGEEVFDSIEDEAEFDKVSALFLKRLEDLYDFEE